MQSKPLRRVVFFGTLREVPELVRHPRTGEPYMAMLLDCFEGEPPRRCVWVGASAAALHQQLFEGAILSCEGHQRFRRDNDGRWRESIAVDFAALCPTAASTTGRRYGFSGAAMASPV